MGLDVFAIKGSKSYCVMWHPSVKPCQQLVFPPGTLLPAAPNPGGITSAELPASGYMPVGMWASLGWAEHPMQRTLLTLIPCMMCSWGIAALSHLLWMCLKSDFLICVQNAFS